MRLVAGLDFGGSSIKACIADIPRGKVVAVAERPTEILHPGPARSEFVPALWWAAASAAMREAVTLAARPQAEYEAVTAASLRQGYLLLDATTEIGNGVLNTDRRGASQLDRLRTTVGGERLYETTGHWPAPQLTMPKLMAEQAAGEKRLDRARTVLFLHDWALWRMSGVRVSEPSIASAGQLLDIHRRDWARELVASVGLDPGLLPTLHDAGSVIGELRDEGLGLPLGLPVVVGGGDTHMAAAGAGGLEVGVVSVVTGSTTPLQASTAAVPVDPERHPWVSAHLLRNRWAVETNAGYTGMSFDWLASITGCDIDELAAEAATSTPGAAGITAVVTARIWSEEAWSHQVPAVLVGFEPRHDRGDVARAFLEAHAYAIRSNVDDLERAIGSPASLVTLLGRASGSPFFNRLVADVTTRPIGQAHSTYPPARSFAWLAAKAMGHDPGPPGFSGRIIEPVPSGAYEDGYARFSAAGDAVRRDLRDWGA